MNVLESNTFKVNPDTNPPTDTFNARFVTPLNNLFEAAFAWRLAVSMSVACYGSKSLIENFNTDAAIFIRLIDIQRQLRRLAFQVNGADTM